MKQSGKTNGQINGVNQLNPQQEEMRMQVVDLELKARYWKAQFEIRDYTLRAEGIQKEYDEYLEAQKVKNEELRLRWEEEMKKLQEQGGIRIDQPEIDVDKTTVYDEGSTEVEDNVNSEGRV